MTKTSTNVAIIGAGIAGSWLAYRLAQRGIETVVIRSDTAADTPTVSQGAAAVFNRSLLEDTGDLASLFVDETGTQHPELQPLVRRYLRQEFDALSRLVEFMPFEYAVIPKHSHPVPRLGAGGEMVSLILDRFVALGGSIIQGRVTHLAVTDGICHGLQYEQGVPHTLQCQALVIATGGFSGLMPDAATSNAGAMLGIFAHCGGTLSNLEFFYRFAFGDVSNGRVLYPEDLQDSRMYRAGSRAQWLEHAYTTIPENRRDLEIFQQYWVHNMDVPHVLERGDTSFSLGPINGYSMGGMAHSQAATTIRNIYTTGESSHSLAADCIVGKPWACSLATAGLLCDLLSERSGAQHGQDVRVMPVPLTVQPSLLHEVKQRLRTFQDSRFSELGAEHFVTWCRTTRPTLPPERKGCFDVLLLAEAHTLSTLRRRESCGFFFRGDFPTADPNMAYHTTLAQYSVERDCVTVDLVPNAMYLDRIQQAASGQVS